MTYRINKAEKGFSLPEVLLAVFIAVLIGIAAVSILRMRSVAVEDNSKFQEAQTRAEEALSILSAIAGDLAEGGSLTVTENGEVNLLPCHELTCDAVVFPDAPEKRTSLAKGIPYNVLTGNGTSINIDDYKGDVSFIRRWRIDTLDTAYKLRKVTIAVFPNERSNKPLVIQSTVVGIN